MNLVFITHPRRARPGLGDRVQAAIHAGLAAAPLPAGFRAKLKGCASCGRRVQTLNRAGRAVKAAVLKLKP